MIFEDAQWAEKAYIGGFVRNAALPIATDAEGYPNLTFVKAGTLDDTSWVDPTVQFWCASAQPWVSLPEKAQSFQKMPG